ncbi:MAG: TetR/AcrR family transcriptional regulator [Coprobacillus sp.]
MKESIDIKERIIDATTDLINQYNGDTQLITARMIAQKTGIGLGLINYHFKSKDNLITVCVQRIINSIVFGFSPEKKDYNEVDNLSDKERLVDWATQVFDFLYENKAICRISILGDLQDYQIKSNSVYTQKGFALALRDNENRELISFMLVAIMQVAFLSEQIAKDIMGYDFKESKERERFIEKTVSLLLNCE